MVYGPNFGARTNWRVDLACGGSQGLLSNGGRMNPTIYRVPAGYDAAREKLEERMSAEMGAIAARDGDKKLRRDDLETFRRMFMIRDSEYGGQ